MNIIIFFLSCIIAMVCGHFFIPIFKSAEFSKQRENRVPMSHISKLGTPSMGGSIFLVPLLVALPLMGGQDNLMIYKLLCFSTVGFGLIGFLDDILKAKSSIGDGLNAKQKLFLQVVLSIVVATLITRVIPISPHFGWFRSDLINRLFFIIFATLLLCATTNAVNLTDGVDGLAGSVSVVILFFFFIVSYQMAILSISNFTLLLLGGIVGFLYYNHFPARVIMGDTGSLALGGAIGTLALLTNTFWLLPLTGVIFVVETLSVIIQVICYKISKKRVFRMAPLHHHLELVGWSEVKIVCVFVLISLVAIAFSLMIYWLV